jgi:hypothetical protein
VSYPLLFKVAVIIDPITTNIAPRMVIVCRDSGTIPSIGINCTDNRVTNGVIAMTALTLDASIWARASEKHP